jgi:hypothetical protein
MKGRNVVSSLLVGLVVAGVVAQEVKHAPTIEQCRADQRLWWDQLESQIYTRLPDSSCMAS